MSEIYRDGLKGGPVLLSTSPAGSGRNFSQPRAHLLFHPCRPASSERSVKSNKRAMALEISGAKGHERLSHGGDDV